MKIKRSEIMRCISLGHIFLNSFFSDNLKFVSSFRHLALPLSIRDRRVTGTVTPFDCVADGAREGANQTDV